VISPLIDHRLISVLTVRLCRDDRRPWAAERYVGATCTTSFERRCNVAAVALLCASFCAHGHKIFTYGLCRGQGAVSSISEDIRYVSNRLGKAFA
jgi:hypothetical protein